MSLVMVIYTAKYVDVEYTTVKPCKTFEDASNFCETVLGHRAESLEPDEIKCRMVGPNYAKWSKNQPPSLWHVGFQSIRIYVTPA